MAVNKDIAKVSETNKSDSLLGQVVKVPDLAEDQIDQMFALMSRWYRDVSEEAFRSDLSQKTWVLVASTISTNEVKGFSTQVLLDVPNTTSNPADKPRKVLFPGDTIVDREYWNKHPIAKLGAQFSLSLVDDHPESDLYWFLISKGYKTYRYLPFFFNTFYPQYKTPTPSWAKYLLDLLGETYFPGSYSPETGLIRPSSSSYSLKLGVAPITERRRRDPDVAFFEKMNPKHEQGFELCCIAAIRRDNLNAHALKLIGDLSAISLNE